MKKMKKKPMDKIELRALGLYFTVSNAGQNTRRISEYIRAGEFGKATNCALNELESMAMDAGSIESDPEYTPDSLYSELLEEAKGWEKDALKKEDKYVLKTWENVKTGKEK